MFKANNCFLGGRGVRKSNPGLAHARQMPPLPHWCCFVLFCFEVLEFELEASHLVGRHCTTRVNLPALFF
jgi:hypothetical protein